MIIAPPADAGDIFPPFVGEHGRTNGSGSGLRSARRDQRRSDHDRRQGIHAAARAEVDVGARLAVDCVLARSARALARRKAGHGHRRSLQLQGLHRSQGRVADRADASTNLDSVSVRDSLTAVVWFKKHTPEQFYDVAYQLVIMPGARLRQHSARAAAHVRRHAKADRQRALSLREVGAGHAHRARSPTRRTIAAAQSSIESSSAPADPATAATQVLDRPGRFHGSFPTDQVAKLDSSTSRDRSPFRSSATPSWR